jgi:hypothetical protein
MLVMLTLFLILAGAAAWRVTWAAIESVRRLPRCNEDMVLF